MYTMLDKNTLCLKGSQKSIFCEATGVHIRKLEFPEGWGRGGRFQTKRPSVGVYEYVWNNTMPHPPLPHCDPTIY